MKSSVGSLDFILGASLGLSANSTFLSEQISHQQPANSIFLSEQTSTSRQPPAKRTCCSSSTPAHVIDFLLTTRPQQRAPSLQKGVNFVQRISRRFWRHPPIAILFLVTHIAQSTTPSTKILNL
jgi:hypothetical protein